MARLITIPTWAAENRRRFLSKPPGVRSPQNSPKSPIAITFNSANVDDAQAMGELTVASRGIFPPTTPPPGNYFRDPANHPDVLVTILNTAMHTAGFNPASDDAVAQHDAFREFINELQRYTAYVAIDNMNSRTVGHSHTDCSIFVRDVVDIITGSLMGETDGGFAERLTNMITGVAQQMFSSSSETHWVKDVAFENVAVPPSANTPHLNPKTAISFAIVTMLRSEISHKHSTATLVQGEYFIANVAFRLMSSNVIAYADYLAGSTITGSDEYVRFLNSGRP